MSSGKTLLFVYNIESGVMPGARNYSIQTGTLTGRDSCNLSIITQTPVGMKKDWKRFVRELGLPAQFLTRNEFIAEVGAGLITFPAVLVRTGKDMLMLASSEEINSCRSLEDLIGLIRQRSADIL